MPIDRVSAAYKALRRATRELTRAGDDLDEAKKAWQHVAERAFGLKPSREGRLKQKDASEKAEADYESAQARYREAQKAYNDAVAELVKAALDAGLDR